MAFKTKAQTLALGQAFIRIADRAHNFVRNELLGLVNAASDTVYPDGTDIRGEESAQAAALKDVLLAAAGLARATRNAFGTLHPTLGYYAGSEDPNDPVRNLHTFYDAMETANEEVEARGFTKASSWTADGGNVGNGTVFYHATDGASNDLDISHAGTLTLDCVKDVRDGATAGQEEFKITGSEGPKYSWDEGGPGVKGGGYQWNVGITEGDFGPGQTFTKMGGIITSIGPSRNAGNLITNGDFEAAFLSGQTTAKVPGWVLDSNHANVTAETADPIAGDQGLNIAGAVVGYQLLTNLTGAKQVFGLQGYIEANATAGTITGTFTLKVKDDSQTHATITVTIGNLALATPTKMATNGTTFVLPANVGANLRIEFEQTGAFGGTGSAKSIKIDNIGLVRLTNVDGGRFTGLFAGLTDWRYQDKFTNATSTVDTGRWQYWVNRVFSYYLPSQASAGDYWVDPTYAAEIGVTYNGANVADGGSIALGSVATGAHAISLVITNTGNEDLVLLVPTNGTNTNISSVGVDYTVAKVIRPYSSETIVLTVTDAGAGAFSTIVDFTNNDASEGTYAITVSGTAT